MAAYLQHASRSRDILRSAAAAVKLPVESFFLQGKAYVASRDPHEADHFVWLQKFAPNLTFEHVPSESWPTLLQRRGCWAINSLLMFPNDGMVSPVFFGECQRVLQQSNVQALPLRSRLVEILLGEGVTGTVKVQGGVMLLPDGSQRIVTCDHLIVSLGPGACLKIQPPLLQQRLADLRLAGVSTLEVATMVPSLVVRWLFNQVQLMCSFDGLFVTPHPSPLTPHPSLSHLIHHPSPLRHRPCCGMAITLSTRRFGQRVPVW